MLWSEFKLRACAPLLVAVAMMPRSATAQQLPPRAPPVRFHLGWPDAALVGASVAVAAPLPSLRDSVRAPCAPCDPADLWAIDRVAVGPYQVGFGTASDVTVRATLGGAALLLVLSRPGEAVGPRLEDLAVYVEAVSVAQVATTALKLAIGRARPVLYTNAATPTVARDELGSLPSGHASTAFSAAAAYWSIMQRRGEAGRRTPQIVGLFALATATAALRVAAHQHFPTDVIAGAVLGTAVGWAIPQLHPMR